MANQNLSNAKNAKNDEFYTQYADIQKEMNAYLDYNPDYLVMIQNGVTLQSSLLKTLNGSVFKETHKYQLCARQQKI